MLTSGAYFSQVSIFPSPFRSFSLRSRVSFPSASRATYFHRSALPSCVRSYSSRTSFVCRSNPFGTITADSVGAAAGLGFWGPAQARRPARGRSSRRMGRKLYPKRRTRSWPYLTAYEWSHRFDEGHGPQEDLHDGLHHAGAERAAEAAARPHEGAGGRVHPAGDRSRPAEVPGGSPGPVDAR